MNTVEGAIVLSAMTLVAAGAVSGFVTLAEHSTAQALARDAARAGALGRMRVHTSTSVTRRLGCRSVKNVSVRYLSCA